MNLIKNLASWKKKDDSTAFYSQIVKEMMEALTLLNTFFQGDQTKIHAWMTTPNPLFGETTAIRLILMGRGHKVLAFMKNAIEENQP